MTEIVLGIPTVRPQTHQTVQEFAANLKRHGHGGTTFLVSDDAPAGSGDLLRHGLEAAARAFPEAHMTYLGAEEKARYLEGLEAAIPGASALLGPGYGGNRNWLLLATLGQHLLSVDDDIHPYGLFRNQPQGGDSAMEGAYLDPAALAHCAQVPFDILGSYAAMLGRPVEAVMETWNARGLQLAVGSHLRDPNVDLALNQSLHPLEGSRIEVVPQDKPLEGRIGIVQTFLSGDPDLDSSELVWAFQQCGDPRILQGKPPVQFVIDRCRPCLLDHDYRVTGAVLGLDNTQGTIPFIPTRLRFEDYLLRIYSLRMGFHVGYCEAVQTHLRSMVGRKNIITDFVVEGLATLMKHLINAGLQETHADHFTFDPLPDLEDLALTALWQRLVEPLHTGAAGGGLVKGSPTWDIYEKLVQAEALDRHDPGPFISTQRPRILDAYRELREAMGLWPWILEYAQRVPLRPTHLPARPRALSQVS